MYIKKTTGYVLPLNKSACQALTNTVPDFSAIPEVYVKKMFGYVVANDIEKGLWMFITLQQDKVADGNIGLRCLT